MYVNGQLKAPAPLLLCKEPACLFIRGWIGPRIELGITEKRKISASAEYETPIPWLYSW
jgi:hypothetical protein